MKHIWLLTWCILIVFSSYTIDNGKVHVDNKHTINLSIENSGNSTNSINTSVQSMQEMASTVYVNLRAKFHLLQQQFKPEKLKASLLALLAAYKYHIIGATIVSAYSYLFYHVIQANHYVADPNLWSNWQSDMSLEELLEIPQKELAGHLLREIQARYTNPINPVDFINPLITFLDETRIELDRLRWYAKLYSLLKRTYLHKIVPINETRLYYLDERIQRLVYLKNMFHTWMADYNIEHNKRTPSAKQHLLNISRSYMHCS